MPICANVLIRTEGKDTITVAASDLEITLVSKYEAKVRKAGATTLPAKELYAIAKLLPDAIVSITVDDKQWATITSSKTKYRIHGLPADQFPAIPKTADVPFFAVKPLALAELIDKTAHAISLDETRYALTGACLERVEGSPTALRFISTDGHRLAIAERDLGATVNLSDPVTIPRKGLSEIRKLLTEGEEAETRLGFVGAGGDKVINAVLERGPLTLVARLVDGQFPAWQQVVPESHSKTLVVERERFVKALARMKVLMRDKSDAFRMKLGDTSPAVFSIEVSNPDVGQADEEIEAVNYDGTALLIGANLRYVTEALGAAGGEKVTVRLSDELSPFVLLGETAGDKFVVMPCRVA